MADVCENLSLPEILVKTDLANNGLVSVYKKKKVKMNCKIFLFCICLN